MAPEKWNNSTMDPRHFNTSANISFIQKYTVDKAFQSLLEESIIFEGPIIQKRFQPNQSDLNLSSARADLFSSIKNKTFDKSWRQEIAKKSMSFSQNQSHMPSFPANCSSWRNVSNIRNIGNHMTRGVSKKPSLSSHQESPSVSKNKSPTKISSFKMPKPKNPRFLQEETKPLNSHYLRSRAKAVATNLQPYVLVKDVKKSSKTTQKTKCRQSVTTTTPQTKSLVTNTQPHEMVNSQKEKLRSLSSMLNNKCNSQFDTSKKTATPQLAASEVPTINNKRKRSRHKKSLIEPIPKRRKVQNTNPNVQNTDPKTQNKHKIKNDPKIEKMDPKIQKSDPKIEKTDPKILKTDPKIQIKAPKIQEMDPKIQSYNTCSRVNQTTPQKSEPKKQAPITKPKSPSKPPPKETIKECFLDKWIVYHDENNIFIKGHVRDCDPKTFWKSTPIVKRINNCILETQSGTKCNISGPPYTAAMLTKGYTQDIIKHFKNGFPLKWRSILIGNSPSDSKITEKKLNLDEKRTRKLPARAHNNSIFTEDKAPIPSTSAEKNIPSEKPLQEESSLSDEISNSSEDDELTEMESTASDLLKLLEIKHKNTVSNGYVNNFENSSMSKDSNNYFVKQKEVPQQNASDLNVYTKHQRSKNRHSVSSQQLKKQRAAKELKMQKKQSIEKSLESDSSEENRSFDTDFNTKLRKKSSITNKKNVPTNCISIKGKVLSPTTKGASPKKQKQLNPKSWKSKSPSPKLTSKSGKSSSQKMANPRTRVNLESDSTPLAKSNKLNKKTRKNSSSQKKTKKTGTQKSSKKAIWTDAELNCMRRAMSKLSPSDLRFWSKVAQKVGKSVTECKNQYYNTVKEPLTTNNKKHKQSAQPKTNEEESQEDYEDDLFESENVKKKSKNLNFNPEEKLEDIFGDLCAFTPRSSSDQNFQSSMSKFFLTPASERHTPASSFSDLEVNIDWDNAGRCIKDFKKNQKKGAGRLKLFHKKLDLQNLSGPRKMKPLDLVSELNKINKIPVKPKPNTENVSDNSDQSYFSDSDN